MIYLLTAIGQPPGGSSTVHIYIQTVQRTTQNLQYIEQHKNQEECGSCPIFAGLTLAFAVQLRKKHGKTSVCNIYCSLSQEHEHTSMLRYKHIACLVITQMQCVYCAVRTESVNTNQVTFASAFAAGRGLRGREDEISLYPFPILLPVLSFTFFL